MPYNPDLPAANSPSSSAEMRAQLNGLDAKIGDCATQASLNDAINAGAAANCDGVAELNLTVSNPPTQAQMQSLADKVDELIRTLKRV
ncbi:MAG: hypothetical protein WCS42_01380 [Verrucomicrobiota bacterium]